MNRKIKVLVVEDDPNTLYGLRVQLTRNARTTVMNAVRTIEEAISFLESLQAAREKEDAGIEGFPDVVLVDMRFRDGNRKEIMRGPEIIRKIAEMRQVTSDLDIKIVCLSNAIDPDAITQAIESGANGYLDKNQAEEGWIEAIVLAHQGKYVFSPTVAKEVLLKEKFTWIGEAEIFVPREIKNLTARAKEVAFLYLACGLTANEIAEQLKISAATVRFHIRNILDSDYMIVALGEGEI